MIVNCKMQISNKERKSFHIPVLKNEVLKYLAPRANENFIDCTIGEGGHAKSILELIKPKGKLLGIELDPVLYKKLKEEMKEEERLILVNDSYSNLKKIAKRERFGPISGILFDLGVCSWHLEKSGRGFSFQRDEPLIMRYDGEGDFTAKKIINEWSEMEIEKILKDYGQEKFAKRIAKEIARERKIKPIEKTFQLVRVIERAVPSWYRYRKIHFATRTFQALRIVVNKELENLEIALSQALEILEKGGKIVVISFHSLEDEIVKKFFKENEKRKKLKILTKKPIRPKEKEIKTNPRSRSAKLRASIKI